MNLEEIEKRLSSVEEALTRLGVSVSKSLDNVNQRPEMTCINNGVIIECVLRDVWRSLGIKGSAERKELNDLREQTTKKLEELGTPMPRRINDYIVEVAGSRNRAAHSMEATPDDALVSSSRLCSVLLWYFETFLPSRHEGKPAEKRVVAASVETFEQPIVGVTKVESTDAHAEAQQNDGTVFSPPLPKATPVDGTTGPSPSPALRRRLIVGAILSATLIVALAISAIIQSRAIRLPQASKEKPWINSLGMEFVPVEGTQVLFDIWDTRVQDFNAFVSETHYDATGGMISLGKDDQEHPGANWESPGFAQGPRYPVVGVSWNDAKAFCAWLTQKEHAAGSLSREMIYRLPTDQAWSLAVGLGDEVGDTPNEKSGKIKEIYPWGKEWPPPKGAGNYAGEESKVGDEPSNWKVIVGYNDAWPRTSPVGAFSANRFGLYDMGGNVWQWCEDWYDKEQKYRVLRGASWADPLLYGSYYLLSSTRAGDSPSQRKVTVGFRCVVAPASSH